MMRSGDIWGAHACGVLAKAFCLRELFLVRLISGTLPLTQSSFRQNVETSTLQACAPRNSPARV